MGKQQQHKGNTAMVEPPNVEQQLDEEEKLRADLYKEEMRKAQVQDELKANKAVLREARQKVRDVERAKVLKAAHSKKEQEDRETVRRMTRAERIAFRRRLQGGLMPVHIKDELDRCDGLEPSAINVEDLAGLSVEDLKEELSRRGVAVDTRVVMREAAAVTERSIEEENAAE